MHNGKRDIAAVADSHSEAATRGAVGRHVSLRPQGDDYREEARKIDSVICAFAKKPGGKLNSPPGLKLGVVIPKAFGVVIKRRALMPLFLR